MKLNHICKSIACGVLLAMTATSCDLDYNPVDTYSDVTEGMSTNCLSVTLIPIMPTPEQRGPKWCLTKPTPLKALILY